MIVDRLMSPADLERVTGRKTSGKQALWFQEQFGVRAVERSDGSLIVTWATFEGLMQKRAGLISVDAEPSRPALRPLRSVR